MFGRSVTGKGGWGCGEASGDGVGGCHMPPPIAPVTPPPAVPLGPLPMPLPKSSSISWFISRIAASICSCVNGFEEKGR
eukprot:258818-Prymnesium_polylepis.2